MYFNTELVQNLGHINVFLELWAQLFKENLGTCRLAIKLEGTQATTLFSKLNNEYLKTKIFLLLHLFQGNAGLEEIKVKILQRKIISNFQKLIIKIYSALKLKTVMSSKT